MFQFSTSFAEIYVTVPLGHFVRGKNIRKHVFEIMVNVTD